MNFWLVFSVILASLAIETVQGQTNAEPNVMRTKLIQAESLLRSNIPQLIEKGIDEGLEALFTSNLAVLPTPNVPESEEMYFEHQQMLDQFINALTQRIDSNIRDDQSDAVARAIEVRNFLQMTKEAMDNIALETNDCDPQTLQSANTSERVDSCTKLLQDDEGGTELDPVLEPNQAKRSEIIGFGAREVRNPFFWWPHTQKVPHENSFVIPPLKEGECSAIVKEWNGLKVVIRPIRIPIWVEPWYARRKIVGFRIVWIWEWVPVEYLKTISICKAAHCDGGSGLTQTINTVLVKERQLLHIWGFWKKSCC